MTKAVTQLFLSQVPDKGLSKVAEPAAGKGLQSPLLGPSLCHAGHRKHEKPVSKRFALSQGEATLPTGRPEP